MWTHERRESPAATGICSLLQIDSEWRQQRSSCTVAARTLAAPRTRARIMPRKRAHTEGTKALRRVLDWVLVIIGRGLGGLLGVLSSPVKKPKFEIYYFYGSQASMQAGGSQKEINEAGGWPAWQEEK